MSEVDMFQNTEALHFHWKRCCWVFKYWQQAAIAQMVLPVLSEYGWKLAENEVTIVWDSDINVQK